MHPSEENEKLCGIKIDDLLTVSGEKKTEKEIYRKIRPKKNSSLSSKKKTGSMKNRTSNKTNIGEINF